MTPDDSERGCGAPAAPAGVAASPDPSADGRGLAVRRATSVRSTAGDEEFDDGSDEDEDPDPGPDPSFAPFPRGPAVSPLAVLSATPALAAPAVAVACHPPDRPLTGDCPALESSVQILC